MNDLDPATLSVLNNVKSNVMSNTPGWAALVIACIAFILGVVALILFSTVSPPPALGHNTQNISATDSTTIAPTMNTFYRISSTADVSIKIDQLTSGFVSGVVSYYLNTNTTYKVTLNAKTANGTSSLTLAPGRGAMYITDDNGYSTHLVGQ